MGSLLHMQAMMHSVMSGGKGSIPAACVRCCCCCSSCCKVVMGVALCRAHRGHTTCHRPQSLSLHTQSLAQLGARHTSQMHDDMSWTQRSVGCRLECSIRKNRLTAASSSRGSSCHSASCAGHKGRMLPEWDCNRTADVTWQPHVAFVPCRQPAWRKCCSSSQGRRSLCSRPGADTRRRRWRGSAKGTCKQRCKAPLPATSMLGACWRSCAPWRGGCSSCCAASGKRSCVCRC